MAHQNIEELLDSIRADLDQIKEDAAFLVENADVPEERRQELAEAVVEFEEGHRQALEGLAESRDAIQSLPAPARVLFAPLVNQVGLPALEREVASFRNEVADARAKLEAGGAG